MKLLILNGPNLNLLGKRQPEIYGSQSFEEFFESIKENYAEHSLEYYHSNHEGYIIDKIHEVGFSYDGIVLNAGAYTHTSIAIADALAAITTPVVEVHISDVYKREKFRHHSYLSTHCIAVIVGKGLLGYTEGLDELIKGYSSKNLETKF